jgi:alpha-ribazole phosphatase
LSDVGELWLWRHPRPFDVAGRCIGRTDVSVDRRRAKRLAHRLRRHARRDRLAREVWTSPLMRCAAVGRWLRRWGWRHHVDVRLLEMDFGSWDGQPWSRIGAAEFAEWERDFAGHAPGGGESLAMLRERVRAFIADAGPNGPARLLVAHAGWINALAFVTADLPAASHWPAPLRYGSAAHWSATHGLLRLGTMLHRSGRSAVPVSN